MVLVFSVKQESGKLLGTGIKKKLFVARRQQRPAV
jgi:hypothetical protein